MPIDLDKAPATLPEEAKRIWVAAFNSAFEDTCKDKIGDERDACSARVAWGAVKRQYKQDADGKWVAKSASVVHDFSFIITKAVVDGKTGEMIWRATASDTMEDLYHERMSTELFSDFIRRAYANEKVPEVFRSDYWEGGMPYVSISHYPDLNGFGSVGETRELYQDGNRLKAKGIFYDTPLGRAAFRAVLKSCNDPTIPPDKKIRISIGFLDWKHAHGTMVFERKSLFDRCPMCAEHVGNKVFLAGQLIHLALTRVPVNQRSDIEVEVSKSMTTRKEDAASIVGEELAEELEREAKMVGKSLFYDDTVLIERSEDESKSDESGECESDEGSDVIVEDARREDVSASDRKRAVKEYGDVKFADPENKKYPIDTKEHAVAAWKYINMPRNAKKYDAETLAKIKERIKAACKKFGVQISEEKASVSDSVPVVIVDDYSTEEPYRPYGGAISFEEVDQWNALQEEKYRFQDAWYTFQVLADNIMADDELEDKPAALANLMNEFRNRLEVKAMVVLSNLENQIEMKSQATQHVLDEAIHALKSTFDDTVSDASLSVEEKLRRIQEPFTALGEVVKSAVTSLEEHKSTESDVKSETDIESLKSVLVDVVQQQLQPIIEKVNLLTAAQAVPGGISSRTEVPQRRSVVPVPFSDNLINKPSRSVTPNLRAIIDRSVGL